MTIFVMSSAESSWRSVIPNVFNRESWPAVIPDVFNRESWRSVIPDVFNRESWRSVIPDVFNRESRKDLGQKRGGILMARRLLNQTNTRDQHKKA